MSPFKIIAVLLAERYFMTQARLSLFEAACSQTIAQLVPILAAAGQLMSMASTRDLQTFLKIILFLETGPHTLEVLSVRQETCCLRTTHFRITRPISRMATVAAVCICLWLGRLCTTTFSQTAQRVRNVVGQVGFSQA